MPPDPREREPAASDALVIGAGVSGLTTALCLIESGFSVRIRTAAPPRETTSRVAGAMWGSTFAGPAEKVTGWASESLDAFARIAGQPGSGVVMGTGVLASPTGEAPPPELFPGVAIDRCEAPPGFAAGFRLTIPVIEMEAYLDHLVGRLEGIGTRIELRPVGSLAEAAAEAPVVVNCAGVGARQLVPDPALRPIRGQHVVVENPGLEEFFVEAPRGSAWTSWFVHGDRVVLGGVAQEDDWDLRPRDADAALILERCAQVEPRLRGARILDQLVGLRPALETIRVQAERIGDTRLVHNYGHGGTGVGLSWGCAREAAALAAA